MKRRQGESESGLAIRPDSVHDLLEVADDREPGQDGGGEPAVVPRAALTPCAVDRVALRGMEGGVTQHDPVRCAPRPQGLTGLVCPMGGGTLPGAPPTPRL